MALLGNYNQFTKNPIQYTGGDSLSGIVGLRYNWNQSGSGRFYGETLVVGVADRCGVPNGYSAPYSWKLPPKTGGLGSNVGVQGSGVFVGSGALGVNIEATIEGLGEITDANLGLILSAVATLSGIGGLSADVLGALQTSATLAGQGDMTASLGALAGAVATLSGTGAITSDIIAKASLSADIYVNQSEASVQQIVDGVWNALSANYNTSGTMGEAVQTGGGGGGGGATAAQIWGYSDRTLTESAGLTTDEHDHLMGLSQFSGGNIIDRTKNNKDLIDKIEEFEKIIKKIPCFDMKAFDTLMNEKIGTIKPVDLSGIQTTLSNLLLEITAQKNLLIDAKNKEKEELIQEKNKLEVEKQEILDKFDNFNENLKEKDTLLSKKQYDIDEKSHKISELELQIQQIQFEKESEKNKAEETINELLELHKGEIEEKDVTEGLLVRAYIDKN